MGIGTHHRPPQKHYIHPLPLHLRHQNPYNLPPYLPHHLLHPQHAHVRHLRSSVRPTHLPASCHAPRPPPQLLPVQHPSLPVPRPLCQALRHRTILRFLASRIRPAAPSLHPPPAPYTRQTRPPRDLARPDLRLRHLQQSLHEPVFPLVSHLSATLPARLVVHRETASGCHCARGVGCVAGAVVATGVRVGVSGPEHVCPWVVD